MVGVSVEVDVTMAVGESVTVGEDVRDGVMTGSDDVGVGGIAVSLIKTTVGVEVNVEAGVGLGRIQGTRGRMVGKVTTIVVIIVAIAPIIATHTSVLIPFIASRTSFQKFLLLLLRVLTSFLAVMPLETPLPDGFPFDGKLNWPSFLSFCLLEGTCSLFMISPPLWIKNILGWEKDFTIPGLFEAYQDVCKKNSPGKPTGFTFSRQLIFAKVTLEH